MSERACSEASATANDTAPPLYLEVLKEYLRTTPVSQGRDGDQGCASHPHDKRAQIQAAQRGYRRHDGVQMRLHAQLRRFRRSGSACSAAASGARTCPKMCSSRSIRSSTFGSSQNTCAAHDQHCGCACGGGWRKDRHLLVDAAVGQLAGRRMVHGGAEQLARPAQARARVHASAHAAAMQRAASAPHLSW